ncbi:MAG: PH domain-containing protein [Crocinitomicaceae bacterium]
MKIKSRRDNFFRLILFGAIFICVLPMWLVFKQNGLTLQFIIGGSIIMAIAGLLLWVWHHTFYSINSEFLTFNSGPFKGKIEIKNIHTIIINKTHYAGLKFGLARNGMVVESSSHMSLYISPKNPTDFVKQLLEINPSIQLKA